VILTNDIFFGYTKTQKQTVNTSIVMFNIVSFHKSVNIVVINQNYCLVQKKQHVFIQMVKFNTLILLEWDKESYTKR
jgi:hypothetical protein